MNKQVQKEMMKDVATVAKELEEMKEKGAVMYLTAIHDKQSETYDNLIMTPSIFNAVRGFMDACKNENSPLAKYAEDFELVKIGEMNNKTGVIVQKYPFEVLVEAKNIVK